MHNSNAAEQSEFLLLPLDSPEFKAARDCDEICRILWDCFVELGRLNKELIQLGLVKTQDGKVK